MTGVLRLILWHCALQIVAAQSAHGDATCKESGVGVIPLTSLNEQEEDCVEPTCTVSSREIGAKIEQETLQLLQVHLSKQKKVRTDTPAQRGDDGSACVPLHNRGTHFTVTIEIGTPGQSFDVVADTGSDSVIVDSCICQAVHNCSAKDKCFTGTNRSSTFHLRDEMNPDKNPNAAGLAIMFGSGSILSMVATDVVRVGPVQTTMTDGLLLMVKRNLNFKGSFEGILGLGLPQPQREDDSDAKLSFHLRRQGFLETAGIKRFSLCFNQRSAGVLRMGLPRKPEALASFGRHHWAVGFHGISVAAHSNLSSASFCKGASEPGQDMPCGAIPDSGTTLIMGPRDHLKLLFAALCDAWPRCAHHAAPPRARDVQLPESLAVETLITPSLMSATSSQGLGRHELFQLLLMDCETWMKNGQGLEEMPSLNFHLADAEGNTQNLDLHGAEYVLQVKQEETVHITEHLEGIFPFEVAVPTGREQRVCMPAFGSHKYGTGKNRPVWILGSPFFYAFDVGYDMNSKPPSVSFSQSPCGTCGGAVAMMEDRRARSNWPRELRGPVRLPSVDTSMPL